jgi:uncharacterized protein YjbI with pentapeptide repeats
MKFEIKHRHSSEILFACEGDSCKFAVELAIKSKIDLSFADLSFADLSFADLSFADLMTFQYQQHQAFYMFDGALRIGCLLMPITEWELGFKEIGEESGYTSEQILMYGQFISMCMQHFKRNNPEQKG